MPRLKTDDIDRFYHWGLMPSKRTIYVGEVERTSDDWGSPGVDYRLADRVVKGIWLLTSMSDTEPIHLIVNNPGGEEYHGLAIYDAIRSTTCTVTCQIIGHAMSMAAWFIQAADHRWIYPSATMMIHYGYWAFDGHAVNFDRWAKENNRVNRLMEDHLLERIKEKHPKYKRQQLREKMLFDCFLTAHEALDLGLVDEVLEYPEREKAK